MIILNVSIFFASTCFIEFIFVLYIGSKKNDISVLKNAVDTT